MHDNIPDARAFCGFSWAFSESAPILARSAGTPPRPERILLSGRYVTLEPLTLEHVPLLWPAAWEEPERWQWLPFGPFVNFASFKVYAKLMLASEAEILWCVRPHDAQGRPGEPAGWVALLDIQNANAAVELGNIWFSKQLAGTRAATETIALLLGHVFGLGYRRVAWKCNALHTGSRHCAERFGFSYEGTLRAHMIVRGARRDTSYYSLLAEEWPDRHAALDEWLVPENFNADARQISRLRRAA